MRLKTTLFHKSFARHLILFSCLLSLVLIGCNDKQATRSPAKKVVSKKISIPSETKKQKTEAKTTAPKAASKEPPETPTTAPSEEESLKPAQTGEPPAPELPQVTTDLVLQQASITPRAIGYNPKGRIDPFVPLIKPEPTKAAAEKSVDVKAVKRRKRIPQTPLERIELNQLRLRAIIRTTSGNMALVEEATGKGYIIKKGTYIGTNQGQVVAVLTDRVVVEEEVENVLGSYSLQKREIKLPKPPGEE